MSHLAPTIPPPRKLSRETRRTQVIEATIEVVATQGYARTTLTDVARKAGISHGLVNFHFKTKDALLAETLGYLSEEYRQNWASALAAAGPSPAEQLAAMLRADFEPAICTPTRLAAWLSFWGEAQSRPLYQDRCGENEQLYTNKLEQLCADLVRQGGYHGDPILIARVLRVTCEGVWVDLSSIINPYTPAEALQTVHAAAMAFFPKHFGATGLL
ncbi:TetR family transcriptional regulator [Cypionkella aquatica]|uniref:TetR family transcriptional regulator n=1 Tax=Cypionkella aquatica TaxID=1756042 RepID=A0AA37WZB2_9RHOB|nr:TetR family transcriptional regulator C-terminal domain-containing protein [Cypionkella aquatica]GLS86328.1 TetR family transcriptional regulator [Cypionkella aquatica]